MRFDVGALGFGDVFQADMLRFGLGNVRGDIAGELLKIFGAGDKIGFAIHFDEDAELAVGADGGRDEALLGATRFLVAGAGDPFLRRTTSASPRSPLASTESLFAIHHACAGSFAEFFYQLCANLSHPFFFFTNRNFLHTMGDQAGGAGRPEINTVHALLRSRRGTGLVFDDGGDFFGELPLAGPLRGGVSVSIPLVAKLSYISCSAYLGSRYCVYSSGVSGRIRLRARSCRRRNPFRLRVSGLRQRNRQFWW